MTSLPSNNSRRLNQIQALEQKKFKQDTFILEKAERKACRMIDQEKCLITRRLSNLNLISPSLDDVLVRKKDGQENIRISLNDVSVRRRSSSYQSQSNSLTPNEKKGYIFNFSQDQVRPSWLEEASLRRKERLEKLRMLNRSSSNEEITAKLMGCPTQSPGGGLVELDCRLKRSNTTGIRRKKTFLNRPLTIFGLQDVSNSPKSHYSLTKLSTTSG